MADGEHTGFPQVSAPASAAVHEEEEENNEDEEAGNSDDDEDMDDINHTTLPKEVVRPNTPTMRPQTADIWKHVSRIAKHDVPDRAMKTECTHVCVYRLDDEDGEKRYCNTPLKLFRASSAKAAPWSTSAALAHFKKKHEDSSSARKQKAGAGKRQTRMSECMHAAGSQGIQSISSRKSTYALSENEKVLSAIAGWATYASMKVSQAAFGDPLFVAMLQAARGPHDTKGLVPKLTRSAFKGFMIAEFHGGTWSGRGWQPQERPRRSGSARNDIRCFVWRDGSW